MKQGISCGASDWQEVAGGMTTRRLTFGVQLLVPPLLVTAFPRHAIGFSFEGGRMGALIGALVLGTSLVIGGLLYHVAGVAGAALPLWLLGTSGAVMLINTVRPIAFVKPLCSNCRLMPVIKEHEAIHLSGVESDAHVWDTMRERHSCASLALADDPAICSFCPIPKRLKEQ